MKPIFLVGYMGAGKSTLGRRLASHLDLKFLDTDIFIENRFRQRIADMFEQIGETAFRKRERIIAEELSGMEDCVIATGGGLPCYTDSMDLLLESGLVIYLEASNEALVNRLSLCKRTRPSVRHKEAEELALHVCDAMAERRPIYERAHLSASVEEVSCPEDEDALAERIAQYLRQALES